MIEESFLNLKITVVLASGCCCSSRTIKWIKLSFWAKPTKPVTENNSQKKTFKCILQNT
jgi:hypothetical protein